MKKIFLTHIIFTFLILQSCSSGDSSNNPSPTSISSTNGGLLLKQIVYDGGATNTFTYNGNKLTKSTESMAGGYSGYTTYSYTGDLITQMKTSRTNALDYVTDLYYSNNDLVQIKETSNGILKGRVDFVYNSNGMVIATDTNYTNGNPQTSTSMKYYYTNGNLVKIEKSPSQISYYTYDTKYSPWRNITGILKLNLAFDNVFSTNNPLTNINPFYATLNTNINYSYQYNSQDYPTTCVITQSGEASKTVYYSYY